MSGDRATPAERSLAARIAIHSRWATSDRREGTAKARAAGPGSIAYWETKVDPDSVLSMGERLQRAESARKAHYTRLALLSARARRKRTS